MASWHEDPKHRRTLRGFQWWVAVCVLAVAGWYVGTARAEVVWRDDFSAPSAYWIPRDACPAERSAEDWLCYLPGNVWTAGGKLHLRQTAGVQGRPYDGAMVSTYRHGYGWAPTVVMASWAPPVKITARARWSDVDGFWQAFTAYSVNREQPTELDIAEMRGSQERYQFCAVHNYQRGLHTHLGTALPFNISERFRLYWVDLRRGKVTFGVGRHTCGSVAVSDVGRIGIDFVAKSADPERFAWAGQGAPVVGPAEYAIDWVQAEQ